MDEAGTWFDEEEKITDCFVTYFETLFNSEIFVIRTL